MAGVNGSASATDNDKKSEELKASANVAFQAHRNARAVELYTQAIQLNSENAVFYSNRAFAHTKLEEYGSAILDATLSMERNPTLKREAAQEREQRMTSSGCTAGNEKVTHSYAAGIAAGVATVLIGHPFDTIKVKLQTQRRALHGSQYRSAFHCCTQLLKAEGIKGLYRGATPSFIGVSVESSLLFGSYSQLKTFLQVGDANSSLLSTVVPAAALAGAGVSAILCPSELVKCRLQVDATGIAAGAPNYDGPLDCIRKTIKTEGVQGLFRGLTATCLREAIGNVCFFVTYESSRHRMLTYAGLDPMRTSTSPIKSGLSEFLMETGIGIISGGLSGIAFWTVVLPVDVAKTRIQTVRNLSTSRSPLVHMRMIYRESGVRGLYAGLGPTLVRAFPANAAAICAWEATARLLARYE